MSRNAISRANARRQRVLALLSDGEFHSGEKLAKRLRISRGGVWKIVNSLRELGIEIQSIPRQGYRLPYAVDLFDRVAIETAASARARQALVRTDVLLDVDSTNRFVMEIEEPLEAGRAQLCVAELQNAGRGRRGRSWTAPFGGSLCMTLGWQFAEAPPTFTALSLAVGVAVVKALRSLGASEVALKWPNDLIWHGRKLGGILIEMRGESAGPARVIIGIGINVRIPAATRMQLVEQQAAVIADLHEIMQEQTPLRNAVVARIASELVAMLDVFATQGFAPFQDEWRRMDTLANAPVKVINGAQTIYGGADLDGTLIVEVDGELRRFASGDVSLRRAEGETRSL
jgi:BirA family biotin operon repressor/biotin-[acetyl-CoA-carboxylase] ligase